MAPDVDLPPPRLGRAPLRVILGLILALLASFGMVDNSAVAAASSAVPVAAVVAEDAVAARAGDGIVVAARAHTRGGALVRHAAGSAARPLRAWWSSTASTWRPAPVPRRVAGRAPPALPAI